MKKIVLIIVGVLLTTQVLIAQKKKEPLVMPDLPTNTETGLFSYTEVVEVPSVSKAELYKRALAWANTYFKNPTDVIREKNEETGEILCKARFRIMNEADKDGVATNAGDVMYSLTISLKDGKYKYELTKFNWQQKSAFPIERWKDINSPSFIPAYAYYLKQADDKAKEITSSLKKGMLATGKKANAEW
ncbi:MAG: hypothetical protein BWY67_00122 [Bacteroidetes bacterium ADurb.Bin397]|jgi:hypothetical protein|nr:MAG: hypothetical protein BWY67_00122 [Bacteroidetes bacterium ADurb.Bin397]